VNKNNLPRVIRPMHSRATIGSRTRDLMIASPTPNPLRNHATRDAAEPCMALVDRRCPCHTELVPLCVTSRSARRRCRTAKWPRSPSPQYQPSTSASSQPFQFHGRMSSLPSWSTVCRNALHHRLFCKRSGNELEPASTFTSNSFRRLTVY